MNVTRSRVSGFGFESTALGLSRAALLGLVALFGGLRLAGVGVPMETQAAVYLVGMVALNLPHGGYEHFANLRRRAREFRWTYVAGYLALAGAFVGLFLAAPVAGLALAVLVAVAKGGGGDLHVLRATTGTGHLRSRAQELLAVAARGGAVMAVPIVAWPNTFHAFSSLMVGLVEPGGLGPVAAYFDVTRPLIGGLYGATVLAHLGLGFVRRPGDGAWLADAAETLLLVAYFAVVPVVVAVGLYFPLWYSARQVARAQTIEQADVGDDEWDLLGGDDPTTTAIRAWGLLVAGALATVAVLAIVYWAVPNPFADSTLLAGAVAFWSIFISIIALPHVAVGSLWDRERGIWYVP